MLLPSHSAFCSLVLWVSFNYEYSPMCCFWDVSSCLLGLWKPQRTTWFSDSQQDAALVDWWPSLLSAVPSTCSWTPQSQRKNSSLSFCVFFIALMSSLVQVEQCKPGQHAQCQPSVQPFKVYFVFSVVYDSVLSTSHSFLLPWPVSLQQWWCGSAL